MRYVTEGPKQYARREETNMEREDRCFCSEGRKRDLWIGLLGMKENSNVARLLFETDVLNITCDTARRCEGESSLLASFVMGARRKAYVWRQTLAAVKTEGLLLLDLERRESRSTVCVVELGMVEGVIEQKVSLKYHQNETGDWKFGITQSNVYETTEWSKSL